jgi:hypothetical protein
MWWVSFEAVSFGEIFSVKTVFRRPSPMSRTLCEMKKLLKTDFTLYKQFVCSASHVCTKCGRAANDKKLLCKPERLKE